MVYTATSLRKNIYTVLDHVLESGIPVEIERNGKRLKIVSEESISRLDRLEPHNIEVAGNTPLEDIHWDEFWNSELPE